MATSHFAQPNTLEWELAVEWRLLQSREGEAARRLQSGQTSEMDDALRGVKGDQGREGGGEDC